MHLFTQTYTAERGWHDAKIEPYRNFEMDPAAVLFGNAQEIFEGMKAYRRPDGGINLFRPFENAARFNRSAQRVAMPPVDENVFVRGIEDLLRADQQHLPMDDKHCLYVRPVMLGTEARLGAFASSTYLHYVMLSDAPAHALGLTRTMSARITSDYVRAAQGGTGEAKTGANYAASLLACKQASTAGYDHVIFLDSVNRRYIEEAGWMNLMFVYDKHVVTPRLNGAILQGITRKSIVQLAPTLGYTMSEEDIDVNTLMRDVARGTVTEAFGCGTGAGVAPLGRLGFDGRDYEIGKNEIGSVTKHIYQTLVDIQHGRSEDVFGWGHRVI